MSRLTLNTNIASYNAQRGLANASKMLEATFSRLSSGMRINRASDDAAGLSVASLLNLDRAVLNQGIRNLNDGVSLINIAESAMNEMSSILIRIKELAEQSANGTLSSSQRAPLQDEVTALQSEYNRIRNSTSFNGSNILRGENTRVNLQAGYGTAGGLSVQIGSVLISSAFNELSGGTTSVGGIGTTGDIANTGSSGGVISADGNFFLFNSTANNIIPGVTGTQTYMRNLNTNEVMLISSSSSGVQGNGPISNTGALSADGRYAIFTSDSTNIIGGVSGIQLYRKDTHTGAVELVSSDDLGNQANGSKLEPQISADGRYVVFRSDSTDIYAGASGVDQIYRKDMLTGEVMRISETTGGVAGNGVSRQASITADGRFVVFRSFSTSLLSGNNVFIKDTITNQLTAINRNSEGVLSDGLSISPVVSADGRYATFRSDATNLISGVSGVQVYRKDLISGEVLLVSSAADGTPGGASDSPQISADGRYIAFRSGSATLIPGVAGNNMYRKDMKTGEIILISRGDDNTVANIIAGTLTSMSADGSTVIFASAASFLDNDTNGAGDSFIRKVRSAGVQELSGMMVSNQILSKTTLTLVTKKLEELSLNRAGVGASSSRIDSALSNLSSMTQNLASASSQITDTDVAEEATKLTSNQILQQSAAAVLAQANLQSQLVLKLLEDV